MKVNLSKRFSAMVPSLYLCSWKTWRGILILIIQAY
ncbi:hypothetical protein BVRB_8g193860 [Beta vulgaris subsp. vulgaris]|nr:hypothetical protein BVRB_8g193860 [Beta vulgaris subsp. vulgaris]